MGINSKIRIKKKIECNLIMMFDFDEEFLRKYFINHYEILKRKEIVFYIQGLQFTDIRALAPLFLINRSNFSGSLNCPNYSAYLYLNKFVIR